MGNEIEKTARSNCGLCWRDAQDEKMAKNEG